MKPTICLRSGIEFDFENPKPEMIRLSDIVHTLPYIVRFGAHGEPATTVGIHTILVYELLLQINSPRDILLKGLLHDATETYVGDMPAPLKILLPEYKAIEKKVAGVISEALEVDIVNLPPEVKQADLVARHIEQFHTMPNTDWWPKVQVPGWTNSEPPEFFHWRYSYTRLIYSMRLKELKPEWATLLQ